MSQPNISELRTKLTEAFKNMRKNGLVARQNFSCCGTCAVSELDTIIDNKSKAKKAKIGGGAYYHRQDTETLENHGKVHIGYFEVKSTKGTLGWSAEKVGEVVQMSLIEAGCTVEWNGDSDKRILVTG